MLWAVRPKWCGIIFGRQPCMANRSKRNTTDLTGRNNGKGGTRVIHSGAAGNRLFLRIFDSPTCLIACFTIEVFLLLSSPLCSRKKTLRNEARKSGFVKHFVHLVDFQLDRNIDREPDCCKGNHKDQGKDSDFICWKPAVQQVDPHIVDVQHGCLD